MPLSHADAAELHQLKLRVRSGDHLTVPERRRYANLQAMATSDIMRSRVSPIEAENVQTARDRLDHHGPLGPGLGAGGRSQ